tara:strand:+ start:16536 stop:16679 length:144 start_codon:yes stop_codon:yes gene_type:complete
MRGILISEQERAFFTSAFSLSDFSGFIGFQNRYPGLIGFIYDTILFE